MAPGTIVPLGGALQADVAARRQAEMRLEVAREMTLVGEAGASSRLCQACARRQQALRPCDTLRHQIAVRRAAEGGAERARQGVAVEAGGLLELGRGDRGVGAFLQQLAGALGRGEGMPRPGALRPTVAAPV